MKTLKYGSGFFVLMMLLAQSSFAVRYTVCQSGDCNFKSVQEAINKAGKQDEIVIMDGAIYAEQVTIDSTKSGLVLRSDFSKFGKKPTIKFQDKVNVGPKDKDEALIDSLINFDQNGALRVLRAANVRIEGIIVDGGGNYPFGYDAVWEAKYALQHGNAAITLWIAGDVVVRDCEMQNAYIGLNVKDRNEGGVFAHPNPADISPENIIPFSAFAQTGNHLVEYCRIHNNSVGVFFESTWDMGATLRYNLFYENHHPTAAIATKVKGLTSEGGNQCGGALMFKDQMISPVAIYNNTFWHNSLIFVGNWKSGGHHLIFNNIYGAPNDYFGTSTTTFATSFEMSKCFANRMHNCIYSAMQQLPTPNYTTITNDLKPAQVGGAYSQPALVSPFPASAEVYWVEMGGGTDETDIRFQSTDPDDPTFLTPIWDDPLVQSNVIDQGWEAAGVKDPNGSRADLGAIPESGNRPVDVVTVRPTKPVEIKGSTAIINFEITPRLPETTPTGFKIVYLYAVTKLDTTDVFGASYKAITTANIVKVAIPATALKIGANTIEVPVPATGDFAFFEMIIEATGTNQLPFTTAVGFIPYRKMEYLLDVIVLDKVGGTEVKQVRAGQEVVLQVKARKGSDPFTNLIDPTDVSLQSRFDLLNPAGAPLLSIPGGISGTATTPVVFTRVPVGGVEFVHVAGRWISSGKVIAFLGSSQGVTVLAGPADSVQFQTPASKQTSVIDPMTTELVKVQAFDKYGNPVDSTYAIQVVSLKPLIGKITDTVEDTKAGGIATFYAMVTDGDKDEIFPLVATLVAKPTKTDTAYLKVGQARDKLWIFYGDTLVPDPTAGIDTCAGIRVPVTIRASKDGKTIATDRNTEFTINLAGGLAAFETELSGERLQRSKLVNGKVKIWITSTGGNVVNGTITLKPDGEINGGNRDKINFKSCYATPKRGAYFTTNGRGAVDMAKVYYERAIEASEIPDSIVFYWPSTTTQARIAKKMDITQDPTDKRILNVVLPQPFAEGFTRYTESGAGLGLAYWANPLTLDEKTTLKFPFDMADSVGPLIATATLIERLTAGNDSMVLTFTENVPHTSVAVNGLTLLKKQADGSFLPVELQILQAEPSTNGATIVTVKTVGEATAPKEGDSLRITPAGPIVDISNNKAHLLNRAVVITTQKIAPDIVSARYEDRNADGKIETVQISFNKGVTPAEMGMQFKWETAMSDKADSKRMTVVNPTTVDVNIDGLFSDVALKDKTSGTLNVTVFFSSYEVNNKKDKTATDGAAPVVTAVEYHYGRLTKDGDSIKSSPDTLYVAFSEAVKGPEQFIQPLLFTTAAGVQYAVTGVYSGIDTKTGTKFTTYVVNPLPAGIHPIGKDFVKDPVTNVMVEKPGDSAWINTVANVTDNVTPTGNIQLNPANKRVAIVVKQPPFELIANVGPNPFNPKNSKLRITLKAVTAVAMPTDFVVNAVIYDKVGNVVKRIPEDFAETNGTVRGKFIEAKDSCVLWWDGTNKQNRIVGIGTYMVLIKTLYTTKPSPTVSDARTLSIGVKEE